MPIDEIKPDSDEEFEPLGIHEGADEMPTRNYNIDHELVMDTVYLCDHERAYFPHDGFLDSIVEDIDSKWGYECFTFHWVDRDELWAWHADSEVDRLQPDIRDVAIICKMNSKYRTTETGEPAKWLRALSGQANLGTIRRLILHTHESLTEVNIGVHGVEADDFSPIDFSHLKAIPQDQVPIWQQFLMERNEWIDNHNNCQ